jgi:hypothetical protein
MICASAIDEKKTTAASRLERERNERIAMIVPFDS